MSNFRKLKKNSAVKPSPVPTNAREGLCRDFSSPVNERELLQVNQNIIHSSGDSRIYIDPIHRIVDSREEKLVINRVSHIIFGFVRLLPCKGSNLEFDDGT